MPWLRSAPEPTLLEDWLTARPYAHRGLHSGGIVENSRAAFEAAMAKETGIEFDVRPARCSTPFVFHDRSLKRLCGLDAQLHDLDADAARRLRLQGSTETIPTLEEILDLVDDRVPLLVEIKSEGALDKEFLDSLMALLTGYNGRAAVMSFDPRVLAWLSDHAFLLMRGLVVSEEGKSKFKGLIERRLAVRLARPDFLAYDIRSLPSAFAAAFRKRGRPVLSWTVRTLGEARIAQLQADQIIHELADAQ